MNLFVLATVLVDLSALTGERSLVKGMICVETLLKVLHMNRGNN